MVTLSQQLIFLLNQWHSKVSATLGEVCFILQQNFTSEFLDHWGINYTQLCLYCNGIFNLNKKKKVKKENTSSFSLAKIKNVTRLLFITSLQGGYVNRSGSNLFEHEKVFQTIGIALPTEQSIKFFTFIFEGFCLNFKSTFIIFNWSFSMPA